MAEAQGLLIGVDGSIEEVAVTGLEDLKSAVGGWIEKLEIEIPVIRQWPGSSGEGLPDYEAITGYINEEGKLLQLPLNRLATILYSKNDLIAGPMVLLGPPDEDGDDTSLSAEAAAFVRALAR